MAQQTTFGSVLAKQLRDFKRELYIGLPAQVVSTSKFSTRQCIDVQPLLEVLFLDGEHEELPMIPNVPVRLPAVSGGAFTMPVQVGDKVWLNFASASLDEYLLGEGVMTVPLDSRRATINDCYVELGFPTFLSNTRPSADDMQLYYRDSVITFRRGGDLEITTGGNLSATVAGDTTVTSTGAITLNSEASVTINAPNTVINSTTNINGTLTISEITTAQGGVLAPTYGGFGGAGTMTIGSATITSDATIGGISYIGHIHLDAEGRATGTPQ